MDIQSDNAFRGNVVEDSFMHGKCYDRPHNYPKLENKQRLNLPPMPHKRINKVYDRTHYSNDMQFGDGSDWSTFPVMKLTKFGWVCDFDGSAMHGDCGNGASLDITDAITVGARVKTNADDTNLAILSKGDLNFGNYILMKHTTNVIRFFASADGASWGTDISGPTITNGIWYHVAITHNGTVAKLYLNGNYEAQDTSPVDPAISADPLTIGYRCTTLNNYFNGTINEARIYNRALSAAKQKDDYWRYN